MRKPGFSATAHTVTSICRYNFFKGCPKARTCTIILRGGAEQFTEETERSLHDAIMIVRRAIKVSLHMEPLGIYSHMYSWHCVVVHLYNWLSYYI